MVWTNIQTLPIQPHFNWLQEKAILEFVTYSLTVQSISLYFLGNYVWQIGNVCFLFATAWLYLRFLQL